MKKTILLLLLLWIGIFLYKTSIETVPEQTDEGTPIPLNSVGIFRKEKGCPQHWQLIAIKDVKDLDDDLRTLYFCKKIAMQFGGVPERCS